MTRPLLLGLTGHVGVGKDAVGAMLAGDCWRSTSFAEALRVEVAAAWHIDPRLLTERATKETPMRALRAGNASHREWLMHAAMQGWSLLDDRSPRWVLQRWAEFRRAQHPDHWVRHVVVWIQTMRRHNVPGLVVTDVRFANEVQALRELGGHIVRVHRPGHAAPLAPDTANHESERHTLIQADADLVNDGSSFDLALEVRRVVHQFNHPTAAPSGIDA